MAMYYLVEDSKTFKVERKISYPVEKVFPYFNNLQNLTKWNNFFSSSKTMSINYYEPYEGKNASLSFEDKKENKKGELYLRYENPNKTLRYQLFHEHSENPTLIDIKFIKPNEQETKIIWTVHTPKKKLLERAKNFWAEEDFASNFDKSLAHLSNLMSNRVEKDQYLTDLKFDTIMVEERKGELLLGLNVSASNKKDALYKNILMNHNKVQNFALNDLSKSEDELGYPILISSPTDLKGKEVSYFIGIPLSKRVAVADNSFSFRTLNPSQSLVSYYKGSYEGRIRLVQDMMQKAKKETMRNGELEQVFLEAPEEGKPVLLKLVLPIYR